MRLELTKRGDYAVRAMLALARSAGSNGAAHAAAGPAGTTPSGQTSARPYDRLSARRISDAMAIPVRFLPQVLTDLTRAGLIEAAPGRSGGYRLTRDPATISLLEVIEAVEGDGRRQACVLRGSPCGQDGTCDVHEIFFAGQEAFRATFAQATLARVAGPATEEALRSHPEG